MVIRCDFILRILERRGICEGVNMFEYGGSWKSFDSFPLFNCDG